MSLKFTLGTARSYTNIMSSRAYDYESAEIYPVFVSPAFSVVYNDPYGHDSNTPFEQFELDVALALGKGSGHGAVCLYKEFDKQFMYDIRVLGHGMIFARAPRLNENSDTTLGLTMKYEFDWHQFYELSSIGPEFAIKQRRRHENSNLEWQFHAGWNVLGSTDYYYHHRPVLAEFEGRNYSMGTGPMTSLSFRYLSEKGSSLTMGFRGYALYDFEAQIQKNAPEPSTGWEFIGVSNLSFEIPLSKDISGFSLPSVWS